MHIKKDSKWKYMSKKTKFSQKNRGKVATAQQSRMFHKHQDQEFDNGKSFSWS